MIRHALAGLRRPRRILDLALLPAPLAWLRLRLVLRAARIGDPFVQQGDVTWPRDLRAVLRAASGCSRCAKVGTGVAWTTLALVSDDPGRTVVTYDPVVREHRASYLELVPETVRRRIEFRHGRGDLGPRPDDEAFDFVFLDSLHTRDHVRRELRSWLPRLRSGGVLAVHDCGPARPEVGQAIADVGLSGVTDGTVFVWRKP
jgi:hypothetical protein